MNILHEFWFVKDCYSIFGKFPGRLSEKYPASIHFWKRKNNRCCWNRTSSNFVNSQIYQFWNKVPCIHTVLESEEQQLFLEQDFTSNLVDSQSFQFKQKILYIHAFLKSEAQNNFCGNNWIYYIHVFEFQLWYIFWYTFRPVQFWTDTF